MIDFDQASRIVSEGQYRLSGYSVILSEYCIAILDIPEEKRTQELLRKLTLDYAQKCLALENADLQPADDDNANADDL